MTRRLPKYPSASKLDLADRCAWPWLTSEKAPDDPPSAEARAGIAAHNIARNAVRIWAARRSSELPRGCEFAVARHVMSWLEERVPAADRIEPEVSFALRPWKDEAYRIGQMSEKGAINARIDLVAITGKHAIVVDWKTGPMSPGTAAGNWQLKAAAWAVFRGIRDIAINDVSAYLVHLTEDGWTDSMVHYDWNGLMDLGDELRDLVVRVESGTGPKMGPWCQYCPHRLGTCPAHRELQSLASKAAGMALDEPRTPADVIRNISAIKRMREWLDAREIQCRAVLAEQGEGDAEGYHVRLARRSGRRRIEGDLSLQARVYTVLRDALKESGLSDTRAEEYAAAATTSPDVGFAVGAIEKAIPGVREAKRLGLPTDAQARALAALESAGLVRRDKDTEYIEIKKANDGEA